MIRDKVYYTQEIRLPMDFIEEITKWGNCEDKDNYMYFIKLAGDCLSSIERVKVK